MPVFLLFFALSILSVVGDYCLPPSVARRCASSETRIRSGSLQQGCSSSVCPRSTRSSTLSKKVGASWLFHALVFGLWAIREVCIVFLIFACGGEVVKGGGDKKM